MTATRFFLLIALALLFPVQTATAQQTLFTIEDGSGTVVLRVLDDGTVETDGLDLQGGAGALQCTGCVSAGRLADEAVEPGNLAPGAVRLGEIAPGAVDATSLAPDAVTSDKVADGAIHGNHVGAGIYASKAAVYKVETEETILPQGVETIVASCADANDLPLQGGCSDSGSNAGLALRSIVHDNWDDVATPATVTCRYGSTSTTTTQTVAAEIICIDVP